jgi:glycine/D-amino acid oxidase-like deaminating enzyme
VVIGGGVSGCSVAYHLAKAGWTDVVLLERRKLTSGTTWHAAGLIGQLRGSANMTRLAKYSADLYRGLEAETGVATGMKQVGSISVALTAERHEELLRQATVARIFDVEVHEISPAEAKAKYPHLNIDGVVGAVALPLDGQCDPANIAMALAKGARMRGAQIFEGTRVTKVTTTGGRVTGVDYETAEGPGHIAADVVVNCGGMWGRDLAAQNGVTCRCMPASTFYLVTEPVEGLGDLPVLRVPDECAYYKTDAGKMMLGAFEPKAKPWGMDGIRPDFEFDTLPEDWEHFMPILEHGHQPDAAVRDRRHPHLLQRPRKLHPRRPLLPGRGARGAGLLDRRRLQLHRHRVSSGGAGQALAHWITEGEPPFDLWEVDIRRAQPFQKNRRYLKERVTETLGLLYADHFPYRQVATARASAAARSMST